jgi:hypothetical protein
MRRIVIILLSFLILAFPTLGWTWHDETHLAIARAAGYEKWFNAAISINHHRQSSNDIYNNWYVITGLAVPRLTTIYTSTSLK